MPSETRWDEWLAIFRELGLPQDSLGPESIVADLGPDYCGRYEVAFTELRRLLLPQKHEISQFLRETHAATASSMIAAGTETGIALESAFASAFRLENLIALFGEGATRNPRRPFHEHFVKQLRDITVRKAPSENPWIWQLLAGKFPPATPVDWLSESTPISTKPEYLQSSMIEALANTRERSMDFIHLSNILDWLSPKEAHVTLAATHRALRPGGFVLIRQLNSSLDIPSLFPDLTWDLQEGRRLQLRDRSFFYPEILLASRP
jgi:S-adenosylmethionine-diacylglycerol 3-amino-3-carboxypropyl transferase